MTKAHYLYQSSCWNYITFLVLSKNFSLYFNCKLTVKPRDQIVSWSLIYMLLSIKSKITRQGSYLCLDLHKTMQRMQLPAIRLWTSIAAIISVFSWTIRSSLVWDLAQLINQLKSWRNGSQFVNKIYLTLRNCNSKLII